MFSLIMLWYHIPQPEPEPLTLFGYPWWIVILALFFCVGTFCFTVGAYILESQSKVYK